MRIKKSVLRNIVYSQITLLAIMLIVSISSYILAEHMMKENITKDNTKLMQESFRRMDTMVQQLNIIGQKLSDNSIFISLAYHDKIGKPLDTYTKYQFKRHIDLLSREFIMDTFVYFKNNDTVVSSGSSNLESRLHYNILYSAPQNTYDEWQTMLHDIRVYNIEPVYTKTGQATIASISQYRRTDTLSDSAVIGVVYSASEWEEAISNLLTGDGMQIHMFDDRGNIIYSTDPTVLPSYADIDFTKDIQYTAEHLYQMYQSPATGIQYMAAVPLGILWSELNALKTSNILLTAAFFCISMGLILALNRNTYKPVRLLVESIAGTIASTAAYKGAVDEIDFIGGAYADVVKKNRQLTLSLSTSFLLKFMQGLYDTQEQDAALLLERYDIRFEHACFTVALISFDNEDPFDAPQPEMALSADTSIPGCYIKVIPIFSSHYAILFNMQTSDHYDDVFEYLTGWTKRPGVAVSLSCTAQAPQGIPLAYEQAQKAMEYTKVFGCGQILEYAQVSHRRFAYQYDTINRLETELAYYIKENRDTEPLPFLYRLMNQHLDRDNASIEVFTRYMLDLQYAYSKVISDLPLCSQNAQGILSQEAPLPELLENLATSLATLRTDYDECVRSNSVVAQINRFIEQNFSDMDLSVNMLGEKFSLHPSYLSRLYREQTKDSISNYISATRIRHAKTLLLESSASIEEIAVQTGFISSSALIKTFKKYENITPGIYRRIKSGVMHKESQP